MELFYYRATEVKEIRDFFMDAGFLIVSLLLIIN